ncbi:thiamine phosphate synthase [Mangrovibacterium sp.]|uniref:thiamine phosphate synthase n=1 Tax=Mangrovibacterium sp. TaxID=1961364 RepID=UPI003567D35C
MEIAKLQFITNYLSERSHLEQVKAVVAAGVKWIQYRPKNANRVDILAEGQEIATFCRDHSVTFIMNDFADIALELNADGVHLGKNDLSPREARKLLGSRKIIGGTANTADDIEHLVSQGVDYVGLGPFRFTKTKQNLSPVIGLEGYDEIVRELLHRTISVPIVAIGGIRQADIGPILNTGVHGIAISSLLSEVAENNENAKALLKLF